MATAPQSNASFLKASVDGTHGSGKSGTTARLAVGISKELYHCAPVLVADSEERWRFYEKTIFAPEGVPLIRMDGSTLLGIQKAIASVEKHGACVFVADQLTTPWKDGLKAFSYADGELTFNRRQQLMNQWLPIIQNFRYGKFHAICCGRIGFEWENVFDEESGRVKLTQGNTKFNAGGGENFGYEADLELEMRRNKRRVLSLLRTGTSMEYVCSVIKDAAAGILNGEQFVFPGQKGLYKPGDYKAVFQAFRAYLKFMATIDAPTPVTTAATSDLLIAGKTPWAANQSEKKALLEELDANLTMCFPSGEGKSKLSKMFHDLTLEYLNGFISWSRMEDECPVDHLMRNVQIVKAVRQRIEAKDVPTDQVSLQTLLDLCVEDVQGKSASKMTLLEAMGLRSLDKVKRPQAIVGVLDAKAGDELAV